MSRFSLETTAHYDSAIGPADGAKLANPLRDEVRTLAEQITALLDAGWREVQVVTEHGWLLLPGGLPSENLPQHLTIVRKGRCARIKEGAATEYQTLPWEEVHFDSAIPMIEALAVGVAPQGDSKMGKPN
jgi:hypothetical protein